MGRSYLMGWRRYLAKTVSATTGAAAGAAAGAGVAVVAGPIGGAAAGAVVQQVTQLTLDELIEAQNDHLQDLAALNRELRDRLIGVQASVDTIIDGPWRTARLYIEEAALMHDARQRGNNLELAMRRLYDAWGMANNAMRRSAVAQEISALCALINDRPGAERWLDRASDNSDEAVKEQSREVQDSIKFEGRARNYRAEPLNPDITLATGQLSSYISRPYIYVPTAAVAQSIAGLFALTFDAALLRQLSLRSDGTPKRPAHYGASLGGRSSDDQAEFPERGRVEICTPETRVYLNWRDDIIPASVSPKGRDDRLLLFRQVIGQAGHRTLVRFANAREELPRQIELLPMSPPHSWMWQAGVIIFPANRSDVKFNWHQTNQAGEVVYDSPQFTVPVGQGAGWVMNCVKEIYKPTRGGW